MIIFSNYTFDDLKGVLYFGQIFHLSTNLNISHGLKGSEDQHERQAWNLTIYSLEFLLYETTQS